MLVRSAVPGLLLGSLILVLAFGPAWAGGTVQPEPRTHALKGQAAKTESGDKAAKAGKTAPGTAAGGTAPADGSKPGNPRVLSSKISTSKIQTSQIQTSKVQTSRVLPSKVKPTEVGAAPAAGRRAVKPSKSAGSGRDLPSSPLPVLPAAKAPAAGDSASLTTGSLSSGGGAMRGPASDDPSFSAYVQRLWPMAHARGVTRATFESAFAGVEPDPKIAELTRKQAEFVKPIWSYLDGATSDQRVRRGEEQAAQWKSTLDAVEQRYGVDRDIVLGVWGMETNFGSFTGGKDVIRSLATLAAMGYRGTFFRDELVTALLILQQRHVAREDMKGSWAGAMGQTQFMPSSFMRFAVDEDGDGHKDIWTSVPDALASTANYLRRNGWHPGLPWGFEVTLPESFAWRTEKADFSGWASHGVRRADGRALPQHGEASLFLPAGANGPVFLVTANFDVIKRYNNSDAYALGVAHLGDRVAGGLPVQAAWPTNDLPLARSERIELQERLAGLGYTIGETDGRLGGRTREALKDFQSRRGFVPDGYAGQSALQALRAAR
jgi:membrane-bound lytic murein transglycosylase B